LEGMTPKKRMLNAYKGIKSDRIPVAPELWYYYPALVLGVDMIEFEREIPFWKALKTTFSKYECEGWGVAFPKIQNQNLETSVTLNGYEETTVHNHKGNIFTVKKMYDKIEPCWVTKRMIDDPSELEKAVDMLLDPGNEFDYGSVINAHNGIGESYLLELWTGTPFFDFIADIMGFENAVMYFMDEDKNVLLRYRDRYIEYQKNFIGKVIENTDFESYNIGCSFSCNSLIGKSMWREWDKPYIQAICDELHKKEKLLHIHFHGKSIETAEDFAQIGIDCVCPFERPPGGDIDSLEELEYIRKVLDNKVTFNGNVHTVETLIKGDEAKVRSEVRQIKEAFEGCNRLIIGTGDQVGRETPEENILAMIDESKMG